MKMISIILILCLTLQSAFGLVIVLKNNKVITGSLISSKKTFMYVDSSDKIFQIQKSIVSKIFDNEEDITLSMLSIDDAKPVNLNKELEVIVVGNTLDSLENNFDKDFQQKMLLLKEQQKGQEMLVEKASKPFNDYMKISLGVSFVAFLAYVFIAVTAKKK